MAELGTGLGWGRVGEIEIGNAQIVGTGHTGVVLAITADAISNTLLKADGDPATLEQIRFSAGRFPDGVVGSATGECPFHVIHWAPNNDPTLATALILVRYPSLSAGVNSSVYLWDKNPSITALPDVTAANGRNACLQDYAYFFALNENPSGAAPQFVDLTGNGNDLTVTGSLDENNLVSSLFPGVDCPHFTLNNSYALKTNPSVSSINPATDSYTKTTWWYHFSHRNNSTAHDLLTTLMPSTDNTLATWIGGTSYSFRTRDPALNWGVNIASPSHGDTLLKWDRTDSVITAGTPAIASAYLDGVLGETAQFPTTPDVAAIASLRVGSIGSNFVDNAIAFSSLYNGAQSTERIQTEFNLWNNAGTAYTPNEPEATAVPRELGLDDVRLTDGGTIAIMYELDGSDNIISTIDSKIITTVEEAHLDFNVATTLRVRVILAHPNAEFVSTIRTLTTDTSQSIPAGTLQTDDRIYDSTANLRPYLEWIPNTSVPTSRTIQLYQGQIAQIQLDTGYTPADPTDRGKEIVGSISTATGQIGTYTGDTLLVRVTSGTFQVGDVLTVTGGGTVTGTIAAIAQIDNNLVGVRPTLQAVYSSIKKFGWLNGDANGIFTEIIREPFPFEIKFGSLKMELRGQTGFTWNFADNASRNLITEGGWAVVSDFTVRPVITTATYVGIDLPPGTDVAGNNIYAAFSTVAGFLSPFDLTEESQAFLYLPTYTRLDVFERTFGKLPYSHLSITELDYIATPFAVPETFDDLKIDVTESQVQNDAPFTGMSISTQAGTGFTAWADATAYAINDVVSNGDRWHRATTAGTSSGTGVSDDTGVTWIAYEGERQVNGTYYPFTRLLNRDAGTLNQTYAWVQEYLANTGQTDEIFALYEGDIMVLQQPGDFIENFATGFDSETTQLRMTAADGTVINFSPPLSLSVPGAADGSRIQIQRVETHVFSASNINTTTNEITLTGHQLTATSFPSLIRLNFADDATLPTSTPQIIDGGVYFVRTTAANLITLSTTEGGSTIDFTDAGTDGAIAFCTATGLTELDNRVVSGGGGYIQSFTLNAGTVLILKGIDWASSGGNASASNFVQETLVWSAAGATSLAQINRATNPDTIHNQIVSLSSIPLARTLVDLNGNQVSSLTPISDGSTLTGISLALEGVGRLQINANDQDGLLAVVDLYLYGVYFSHTEGGIRLVNSDTFNAIDLFNFQIMNLEIDNTSSDFLQVVGATLSDIDGKGIVSPSTTGSVAINVGTTGTGALIETGVSGLTADESNQLSNAATDSATAATNSSTLLTNLVIVDANVDSALANTVALLTNLSTVDSKIDIIDTTVDTIQTDIGTLLSNLSTVDTKTSNIEDVIELLGYTSGSPLTRVTIGNTTTLTVGTKVVTIVDINDTTTTITRTS